VEDNSHAGQGAVVLDIGGDVGALVVTMPAALAGTEIEARPVAGGPRRHGQPAAHEHGSGRHRHDPGAAAVDRHLGHGHLPHVAVLARPLPDGGQVHSAVFPALPAGTYELYERPAGPVRLSVRVAGGAVTDAAWP
jgi:hypothetical protein